MCLGPCRGPAVEDGIGEPGGWILTNKPEPPIGPHVVVPEHAARRTDALSAGLAVARVDIRPDWVCEVPSPETEGSDRDEQAVISAASRVGQLWPIDPIATTIGASSASGAMRGCSFAVRWRRSNRSNRPSPLRGGSGVGEREGRVPRVQLLQFDSAYFESNPPPPTARRFMSRAIRRVSVRCERGLTRRTWESLRCR